MNMLDVEQKTEQILSRYSESKKRGCPTEELSGMIERSESMSGAGEAGANLNDLLCVTYHKKCHDCGRFLPRERWVRTDDKRKAHGLCHDCYSQYDDPAFL